MKLLCESGCTASTGVERLEHWINEIHRWGLTKHASSCKDDVKLLLRGNGIRTSDIGVELR